LHALIDPAPDGIVIVNQEGRIILVNLQTERLLDIRGPNFSTSQ
jgi:PAS domain-containing protein